MLSHGGPSDPFWVDWNAGATKACEQLKVDLQDLLQRRRHGRAEGGVQLGARRRSPTASPPPRRSPGCGPRRSRPPRAAGIPIVFFNTDDVATGRQAYVGADLKEAGVIWARYLVDNKLVKQGDKVFLPVEVPGASYQQLETEGIASVFDPLGIKYDVVDCGTDPAGVIAKMTDYMVANKPPAIIALGDLRGGQRQARVRRCRRRAGHDPGRRLGQFQGYGRGGQGRLRQRGAWQFPSAQGFMPVALLNLAASGEPIGYDIHTFSLYDKSSVDPILKLYNK